jgi:hypothetical protein
MLDTYAGKMGVLLNSHFIAIIYLRYPPGSLDSQSTRPAVDAVLFVIVIDLGERVSLRIGHLLRSREGMSASDRNGKLRAERTYLDDEQRVPVTSFYDLLS